MSELNVRVEELSPVVRRLAIEVPADRVLQAADSVYARLGRTVKLRGYRQGHVPRRVLEKYFADQVKTDVARELVDRTFPEALGNTTLVPVAAPTVEPSELKLGEMFSYTARVEVRPEVVLAQYKGLDVEAAEAEVTDAQVAERLEQLRDAMATVVPVEGREVLEDGDLANVSYEVAIEGAGKPQKRDDALVRIEPGLFIEGHGEKLVGMKLGEVREFVEHFPDADVSDELKGRAAQGKVTLTGIKKRELPALDDEFAKDVGGADSLDQLRAKVRQELEERAAAQAKEARREALLRKLVEVNPLEVPPALVDSMAERMAAQVLYGFARRGMQLPSAQEAAIVEQLKRESQPRAAQQVRSFFLLEAIAKAENFVAEAADLNAKFEELARDEGQPLDKVKSRFRTPQALQELASTVRTDKALAFLEASATFRRAAPGAGGEATPA
jgi:trigger factor